MIRDYRVGLRTSTDGEEDVLSSWGASRDKVAHLQKVETPSFFQLPTLPKRFCLRSVMRESFAKNSKLPVKLSIPQSWEGGFY